LGLPVSPNHTSLINILLLLLGDGGAEAVIWGDFWPLWGLNTRKTTHIRAKPFETAPYWSTGREGPFSLPML
jgi:hypothetical protein